MASVQLASAPEHLTPHDLVTYSRCPFEMELVHASRASLRAGTPVAPRTPLDVIPERHSPLFSPPVHRMVVNEGRLDLFPTDTLIYEDEGEDDLPMIFPPQQVRIDERLKEHGGNLIDPELGFAGRPDLIVKRSNGGLFPVEYKSTHLFVGYHESHGRPFDAIQAIAACRLVPAMTVTRSTHLFVGYNESHGRPFDAIQAIAECRLVHAMTGTRPTHGVVLYGDAAGDGAREGWVEVPYGEPEEHWLRAALAQIRADKIRPPVPAERNCASCGPNGEGKCRFAAARPESGPHGGGHPGVRPWAAGWNPSH